MKNLFKWTTKKEETQDDDMWLFDIGTKIVRDVKPEKELLSRIINNIEENNVTNIESIRNTIREEDGRVFRNPFYGFISNMNENMNKVGKILSGTAVASILVLIIIFVNVNDKKIEPLLENNLSSEIMTGNELVDIDIEIDSLIADLSAIDGDLVEPMYDDSDLLLALIETNEYEIQ